MLKLTAIEIIMHKKIVKYFTIKQLKSFWKNEIKQIFECTFDFLIFKIQNSVCKLIFLVTAWKFSFVFYVDYYNIWYEMYFSLSWLKIYFIIFMYKFSCIVFLHFANFCTDLSIFLYKYLHVSIEFIHYKKILYLFNKGFYLFYSIIIFIICVCVFQMCLF